MSGPYPRTMMQSEKEAFDKRKARQAKYEHDHKEQINARRRQRYADNEERRQIKLKRARLAYAERTGKDPDGQLPRIETKNGITIHRCL